VAWFYKTSLYVSLSTKLSRSPHITVVHCQVIAQYELRNEAQYVALGTGAITLCVEFITANSKYVFMFAFCWRMSPHNSSSFVGRLLGIGITGSVFENMIPVNIRKYAPSLSEVLIKQVQDNANAVWHIIPGVRTHPTDYSTLESLTDWYLMAHAVIGSSTRCADSVY
jgi:hypothetical protein